MAHNTPSTNSTRMGIRIASKMEVGIMAIEEESEKKILKIKKCVVKEIQGEVLNVGVGEPMPPEPPTYDFTYTVTFDANGGWTGNSKVQVSGNEGDEIYLSFLVYAHWT